MSNILTDVQTLIAPAKNTARVGVVTGFSAGGMLTVKTSSDAEFTVEGSANRNDTVLFDESKVVAILKREKIRTYYIT